jgi:plasmid stabilization system protein ParE
VTLIVSPAALADLERLHTFLMKENPSAAQRAVAALTDAIQSLGALPERGRPVRRAGARELIVPFGSTE